MPLRRVTATSGGAATAPILVIPISAKKKIISLIHDWYKQDSVAESLGRVEEGPLHRCRHPLEELRAVEIGDREELAELYSRAE